MRKIAVSLLALLLTLTALPGLSEAGDIALEDASFARTIFEISANFGEYEGRTLTMSGYVIANEGNEVAPFSVNRDYGCCTDELAPYGFDCAWDGGIPAADAWVTVTGTIGRYARDNGYTYLLLTLSSQDQRATEAALRSSYEDSVREYQRLSELQKSGGVSKSQVEQALSRMKSEEARLQASRSTLSRTQLRASIDGIVASRMIEPGEVAGENKPLLTVIDLKDLEAEIMVSRRDIMSLSTETPVEVVSDGARAMGVIRRISPEAAPGSGLYTVVVGLNGLDILPGTHVEARFLVERRENLLVVPSDIVQRRGDKAYVYVVEGDRAKLREIVPGEGQNGSLSVDAGLSEGDLVAVRGHNLLYENALVTITREDAAGSAGK